MSNALRLETDVERVRALARAHPERIGLLSVPAGASQALVVELRYPTARNRSYPAEIATCIRLRVTLPSRYPFLPPVASIETPVYHPNVFPSGLVCLGTRWLPSEGLDLFLKRVIRLLTFDPLLVNVASPANREAASWYQSARRRHPGAFPSCELGFATPAGRGRERVGWRDAGQRSGRSRRRCPGCARELALPAGRRGTVRCPACGQRFETET
ncbi:MAG TPA: ubiquitin-conjugating enzyme E2 [Steroidobacteraceae bacterium]|nr:ubiquitin-conjugating enzyme E2 [Steroidobacteraceae bacterium]